ncbi:WD REPEATS REGION domain-containing protein [Citrus sinensis]|uniref:WD REPEATS REGION domain-containing protein n=1 Tax=Citrus sinensis TaxID=2711 RepID=A0ACB8IDY4_CITSI|nr:WD REPEATS REGION domain-containing protein [Citrus sinensis]
MATDIHTLEQRYFDSCRRHDVLPNPAILSGFFKADVRKSQNEPCTLEIILEYLKDIDFQPLLEVCMQIGATEIEAVDVRSGTSCMLTGEFALSLMHAIDQKLRVVDLHDSSFGKDFIRNLSQRGLMCEVLNLRSSRFRKLNMIGEFKRIHTLNLDYSTSLTSFKEDCFSCMPNLICLSMCETRVGNLWTTIAALSKLPSLAELRFQNWLCCDDTGNSSGSSDQDDKTDFSQLNICSSFGAYGNVVINPDSQILVEDSSDDSEVDFSIQHREYDYLELLSNLVPQLDGEIDLWNEVSFDAFSNQNEEESSAGVLARCTADVSLKYISCHASPICFEKHYRDYMIASLPKLKFLDNLPIRKVDRERATITYSQYFEHLPYGRKHKESVVSILQQREIKASQTRGKTSRQKTLYPSGMSQYFYTRSLCAAKVGSSAWPCLHTLTVSGNHMGDENRSFRPRQFEYHPSISCLMVFGTLDGEIVVVNHENENIVSYIPSFGAMNSVLGLCWLKKYPSKLIAGSDNGSLKLYDIRHMPPSIRGMHYGAGTVTFDEFDQLTSVHVNSMDELFLASGYSKNIALYDINSGRRLQVFADMHKEHINVVKFSNHSPSIFATSSFDQDVKLWDLRQKPIQPCYTASSSKGNVMVCFSPDDHYLLVSAVDNEVRQLLAVDGRVHLNFGITATGSSQNYTRSYYLNGRDYIVSGSCDEQVVRICCAQTGRRLRDISLEGKGSGTSMFVQSLRGDPFRDFNMSILAAYTRPSSKSEIVKVNLLASTDHCDKECSHGQHSRPSRSMGG